MTLLEGMEAMTALMKKLEVVAPWAGFLLVSIVGGATAYVKEWEDSHPERTFVQHCWALLRRLLFAVVAGILWYQIVASQNMLSSPLSYLGATLVGLYSTQFMDYLWQLMKSRMTAKIDTPPPPPKE